MFTGLVEDCGVVREIQPLSAGIQLLIDVAGTVLETSSSTPSDFPQTPTRIGDSVSINGCCLTVVEISPNGWAFQAGTETLSKTNLGNLEEGSRVNLERSLPVNGRLGGHFVQGHVDGVGTIADISREGTSEEPWVRIVFAVPKTLTQQMVPKGSIAVDGVSLTLVDVEPESFSVALIPHTLEVTTLGQKQPGDSVNIETDILGKYVQKLITEQR